MQRRREESAKQQNKKSRYSQSNGVRSLARASRRKAGGYAPKRSFNPADFPRGRISRAIAQYPGSDWMMMVLPCCHAVPQPLRNLLLSADDACWVLAGRSQGVRAVEPCQHISHVAAAQVGARGADTAKSPHNGSATSDRARDATAHVVPRDALRRRRPRSQSRLVQAPGNHRRRLPLCILGGAERGRRRRPRCSGVSLVDTSALSSLCLQSARLSPRRAARLCLPALQFAGRVHDATVPEGCRYGRKRKRRRWSTSGATAGKATSKLRRRSSRCLATASRASARRSLRAGRHTKR